MFTPPQLQCSLCHRVVVVEHLHGFADAIFDKKTGNYKLSFTIPSVFHCVNCTGSTYLSQKAMKLEKIDDTTAKLVPS